MRPHQKLQIVLFKKNSYFKKKVCFSSSSGRVAYITLTINIWLPKTLSKIFLKILFKSIGEEPKAGRH